MVSHKTSTFRDQTELNLSEMGSENLETLKIIVVVVACVVGVLVIILTTMFFFRHYFKSKLSEKEVVENDFVRSGKEVVFNSLYNSVEFKSNNNSYINTMCTTEKPLDLLYAKVNKAPITSPADLYSQVNKQK